MPHKVIVWGTGFTGKMVIRELLEHPAFELVGVIVNDPAKDGKDVGELLGLAPTGMKATRDVDAALRLDADAVAYFGPTAGFAAAHPANMSRRRAGGGGG